LSARGEDSPAGGPRLVTEERGPFAVIRLVRPAERNPLSTATLDELDSAFITLSARTDLRAVIFTGSGDAFASGADIRELEALSAEAARGFSERGQRLFGRVAGSRLLTVAAVNGFCMGGGLDLALSCDLRVASASAVFGHPGARLGVITGWGGTQRLPAVVGATRALEMFLTARRVSATEALGMGLVSRVCDPVVECALGMALNATE